MASISVNGSAVNGHDVIECLVFPTAKTTRGQPQRADLADLFEQPPEGADKASLPLVQFAHRPGNTRARGTPVEAVTAIVVDYDAGRVPFDEAIRHLHDRGIRAYAYTTPSHAPAAPRYRIVAPLSAPISPDRYEGLVSLLNGALGGIAAAESWEANRGWFVGRVTGVEYRHARVEGETLDVLDMCGADWEPIGKPGRPAKEKERAQTKPADKAIEMMAKLAEVDDQTLDDLRDAVLKLDRAALERLHGTESKAWIQLGYAFASLRETEHGDDALRLWHKASKRLWHHNYDPEEVDRRWPDLDPGSITYKSVFAWAKQAEEAAPLAGEAGDPVELDLAALPIDPPEIPFVIPGWMPEGFVTLFAAHGGTGKSFLSLYVGLCLALGRHPFTAEPLPRVKVLIYSAEDNINVMQLRLRRYLTLMGIDSADLVGWLSIYDATGCENVLYTAQGNGAGRLTPRFTWLAERVATFGADVLIFDNASDAMDAPEIDRAKVRQFLSSLKRVAPTVLLLAHVDAASSQGNGEGKGYSGSTAWHNSARSRWIMRRDEAAGEVILSLPKNNYAESGSEVRIKWSDSAKVYEVVSAREGKVKAADTRLSVLRLIKKHIAAGEKISTAANSQSCLWKVIEHDPEKPEEVKTRRDASQAVAALRNLGLLEAVEYRNSHREVKECLALTAAGEAALVSGKDLQI